MLKFGLVVMVFSFGISLWTRFAIGNVNAQLLFDVSISFYTTIVCIHAHYNCIKLGQGYTYRIYCRQDPPSHDYTV